MRRNLKEAYTPVDAKEPSCDEDGNDLQIFTQFLYGTLVFLLFFVV